MSIFIYQVSNERIGWSKYFRNKMGGERHTERERDRQRERQTGTLKFMFSLTLDVNRFSRIPYCRISEVAFLIQNISCCVFWLEISYCTTELWLKSLKNDGISLKINWILLKFQRKSMPPLGHFWGSTQIFCLIAVQYNIITLLWDKYN